jgi:hypothetical protein
VCDSSKKSCHSHSPAKHAWAISTSTTVAVNNAFGVTDSNRGRIARFGSPQPSGFSRSSASISATAGPYELGSSAFTMLRFDDVGASTTLRVRREQPDRPTAVDHLDRRFPTNDWPAGSSI